MRDSVKAYWGVDEADKTRLREIVSAEFDGPLRLVSDRASHTYRPTLSTVQTLFSRIRPGGYYMSEDWACEHWPARYVGDDSRANHEGLSALASEMIQAAATSDSLIKCVTLDEGFAAFERTDKPVSDDILLRDFIVRRPSIHRQPNNGGYHWKDRRSVRRLVARDSTGASSR